MIASVALFAAGDCFMSDSSVAAMVCFVLRPTARGKDCSSKIIFTADLTDGSGIDFPDGDARLRTGWRLFQTLTAAAVVSVRLSAKQKLPRGVL